MDGSDHNDMIGGGTPSASENDIAGDSRADPREVTQNDCTETLLCGHCRHPIASTNEVLREKHAGARREHVYSYELDLFSDNRPVWIYSATNPNSTRFDVVRILPYPSLASYRLVHPSVEHSPVSIANGGEDGDTAAAAAISGTRDYHMERKEMALVSVGTNYSLEHTFFEGYAWSTCTCATCTHFLGWGFRRSGDPTGDETSDSGTNSDASSPEFLGIIVTRCTGEGAYPVSHFVCDLRTIVSRRNRSERYTALRHQLFNCLNQVHCRSTANEYMGVYLLLESRAWVENTPQTDATADRIPEERMDERTSFLSLDESVVDSIAELLQRVRTILQEQQETVVDGSSNGTLSNSLIDESYESAHSE